jgi:hypothetical protein
MEQEEANAMVGTSSLETGTALESPHGLMIKWIVTSGEVEKSSALTGSVGTDSIRFGERGRGDQGSPKGHGRF